MPGSKEYLNASLMTSKVFPAEFAGTLILNA